MVEAQCYQDVIQYIIVQLVINGITFATTVYTTPILLFLNRFYTASQVFVIGVVVSSRDVPTV